MSPSQPVNQQPLVTIGMPVYNENRFLERALESLLNQDYENIRILISDNASTDDTGEIGTRVARANEPITYSRADNNIGASANFRRVQAMAVGKYFIWAGGHDEWSENLVSESVAKLESNDSAAIAFATSYWIDESGQRCERVAGNGPDGALLHRFLGKHASGVGRHAIGLSSPYAGDAEFCRCRSRALVGAGADGRLRARAASVVASARDPDAREPS